jgi:hypothetical protein
MERWAVAVICAASASARVRASAMMCDASARASSRILEASTRALLSWASYFALASSASFWACSALAMPPSILAARSLRQEELVEEHGDDDQNDQRPENVVAFRKEQFHLASCGHHSVFLLSRSFASSVFTLGIKSYLMKASTKPSSASTSTNARPRKGLQTAAELRLASGAFDGLADQDAQTDARADGGEAVANDVQVAGNLSEGNDIHDCFLSGYCLTRSNT